MGDIVERLRSSEPLPACPFDRISPLYLMMPDDKPCPFCGQENTSEGPDKCRGADTGIMGEAAAEIEGLRLEHQHACQEIGVAVHERDAFRSALEAVVAAKMPGEARRIAAEALRGAVSSPLTPSAPDASTPALRPRE